jgi:hypothetical protein
VGDLSQTVYLFLGAIIYQGIYLFFPESHPQSRRIGAALAAGGVIAAIVYSRGLSIPSISALSLAIYGVVALPISVGLALLFRVVLKRDASRLVIDLEDWSVLARARLPQFTTSAVISPEAQRLDAEYKEKFGPRIIQLMKPLIADDSAYTELRDTWLRAGSKTTLDVASSAHLASKFFQNYGNRLAAPRFDKAFVKSVATYFAAALVLWLALFVTGKTVVTEDGSVSRAVMRTVDNSESPYPIPAGTNQLFAASAADRETELILPLATGSGDTHLVKKTDSNPHSIQVTPRGSDTIDGSRESINITIQNDVVRFVDRGRGQWALE